MIFSKNAAQIKKHWQVLKTYQCFTKVEAHSATKVARQPEQAEMLSI
jgi:hypothetical protein